MLVVEFRLVVLNVHLPEVLRGFEDSLHQSPAEHQRQVFRNHLEKGDGLSIFLRSHIREILKFHLYQHGIPLLIPRGNVVIGINHLGYSNWVQEDVNRLLRTQKGVLEDVQRLREPIGDSQ